MHHTTYVMSYRLMDTNHVAHPILDVNGVTNTAYTYNVTNTILVAALSTTNFTPDTPAALKPVTPLNPYDAYYVELKIDRLGLFTGAIGSNSPTVWLEFTNLTSPDPALNTIPYQFGPASWVQTYAVETVPGQNAFAASTFIALFRYDNFSLAPTTDNVTVHLNYELHKASNGALVPLQNSTTNFTLAVASYTAGTPQTLATATLTGTFLLEPVNPIDSVDFNYYVVVNLAMDNGLGPPYVNANTIQSAATQLLGFNGNVFFGSIGTDFDEPRGGAPGQRPQRRGYPNHAHHGGRLCVGEAGSHLCRRGAVEC